MTKTGQDNDVTDHTNLLYAENEIELSCLIQQCIIYDENYTRQQHDRWYSQQENWN